MSQFYYKATDGVRTVFRASASQRTYRSARIGGNDISFRSAPPCPPTSYPAIEITRGEYESLVALKRARIEADVASGKIKGAVAGYTGTRPCDSWVWGSL